MGLPRWVMRINLQLSYISQLAASIRIFVNLALGDGRHKDTIINWQIEGGWVCRRLSRCSMEYELFYCRWRIYFWLRIIIRIRHSHNFQSLTLTCTLRRPQPNPTSKLHTIDWLRDTTDPEELKWLTRYAATAAAFQVVMDQVEEETRAIQWYECRLTEANWRVKGRLIKVVEGG